MARVLIIDDSSSARAILKGVVAKQGHEVVEAVNGEEGLKLLDERWPVALVLLDWRMEKMDGPAFIAAAKQESRFASLRVMMVTAESDIAKVREAAQSGICGYIVKPFDREMIAQRLLALKLPA